MSMLAKIPRATYAIRPQTGFSSSLMDTIVVSKSKIQEWVQHEKAKAEKHAETYRKQLIQEQSDLDSKATTLLTVQLERGLTIENSDADSNENSESIANRKMVLEQQQTVLQSGIDTLISEYEIRENRIQEIVAEESKQRARAQEARALKDRVEEAKKTTVDDLTRGIVNYKYLGLDFEKTDIENELRFFFSRIDPNDSTRQFSFVLQVDDTDKYEIVDCRPAVDPEVLIGISNVLNQTDDMSYLVRQMRHKFTETL